MPETTFLSSLTGSFSTSAAQNPTVAIMEAAYADAGLDCRYLNCEVPADKLADAVRGAVAMDWIGFNCSIPHKVAVLAAVNIADEYFRLKLSGEGVEDRIHEMTEQIGGLLDEVIAKAQD